MTTLTICLPDDTAERLKSLAKSRGLSTNKLVEELSARALAAWDTENHFRALAATGDVKQVLARRRRCSSPARCSWNCLPKPCRRRCSRVFYWRCIVSKIIESLRGDLAALQEAGAIGKVTMREFDAICPPPVREFGAAEIKRLREALKFSQPVFALHLHTSASTVRKWEQGETRPAGPALKLLNVIADKGLQAII